MTTEVRCSRCNGQRWTPLKVEAPYVCARCRYDLAALVDKTKRPDR